MKIANITVGTETEIQVFESFISGKHTTCYTAGESIDSAQQDVRLELAIHGSDKGLYPIYLEIDTFTYLGGIASAQHHGNAKLLSHQQFTLEQLEVLRDTIAKFIAEVKAGKFTE